MEGPVIKADHISKGFRKYKNNHQRLQNMLFGLDMGEKEKVLRDISFEINKGEKVGLIGVHGAGKTTLMQVLAGILKPDHGTYSVPENIVTVFDHRLCFDGTLSVRTNIRIKCAVLGWSKEETERIEKEALEFAEIEDMADKPLRSLQKGTATRLGFLLTTAVKPEVLLFDEALGTAGAIYEEKYQKRLMDYVSGEDQTVLMTITNMTLGKQLCTRGLVMNEGKVVFDGTFEDAVKYYRKHFKKSILSAPTAAADPQEVEETDDSGDSGDSGDFGI